MRASCVVLTVLFLLSPDFLYEQGELFRVTPVSRKEIIARSIVWHPTDVEAIDIASGPPGPIAVPPETEVNCTYTQLRESLPGYSKKFLCTLLPSMQLVRIKYGSGEAHAEVAGTRLLWALGFYTDHDYPVRLRCFRCPQNNPSGPSRIEPRIERVFTDTVMEETFHGKEIGEYKDEGWTWYEVDQTDHSKGGATRAQADALKLLAVFIQHTDSKASQQRIACDERFIERWSGKLNCRKPFLMIQDLGQTFGKGARNITDDSSMRLQAWKSAGIWKSDCTGNLVSAEFAARDGLNDPRISEEGRRFLADLLNRLSDRQIYDLFKTARADQMGDSIDEGGRKRAVKIEDWVAVFKEKRREINERRCR